MSACTWASCQMCGGCTDAWEREDAEIEVCPDCLGSGEVIRCDGSDRQVVAPCGECEGKGWIA